ncbi:SDR family oxidoreductase [Novosphingobium resinovorum]|uniref:SDR family oxidoreductase n=1 Tax=Novosphingobium resinovorum TaxID=158500 RepID=UPI002ED303D3|nr:sugar nucleotide-binding protein [Novosphingobium resinovorum]
MTQADAGRNVMETTVVIGAGGLLGSALAAGLERAGGKVVRLSRGDIDLVRVDAIAEAIARAGAVRVFNCAAHTDLEAAQDAPGLDRAVNCDLAGAIARASADQNIPLVHFSSTGCYGDWKETPYVEDDEPRPLSNHHQAKLAGEHAVAAAGGDHAIFRLGWLYGGETDQPKNFVWKRIVEAAGKTQMTSDAVQCGCPTYVEDVVRQVLLAVGEGQRGVFNAVSQGSASRCDYVRTIVSAAGLPCVVEAGPGFARKAPVSSNETAVNARLQAAGLDIMPHWRDSLASYVTGLLRDNPIP